MDIKLNLINRSQDINNSQIIIFQKSVASGHDEPPVASLVISNGAPGEGHAFSFPVAVAGAASLHQAAPQFKPVIWIGVAPEAAPGQAPDAAALPGGHTELSLQGVVSADIVMTGGGPGRDSTPFQFALENVVMA